MSEADPLRITSSLLETVAPPDPHRGVFVFALGKAAPGMARAAVAWLGDVAVRARGIVVSTGVPEERLPGFAYWAGDHPLPAERSLAAADAIADAVRDVQPGDYVLVLISGGTSSLIGAPVAGIASSDYHRAFEILLRSGLAIDAMNAVRKQISRWANGRLAFALRHAEVQPVIISDVANDDSATIGSGPCDPDASSANRALSALRSCRKLDALPFGVREVLTHTGTSGFTAGDSIAHVAAPRIAKHGIVAQSVLSAARERGMRAQSGPALAGDAREFGRTLASFCADVSRVEKDRVVIVSGGETTVTLEEDHGLGGRCQEVALSAAETFTKMHDVAITLLVAGTDGRDGPTDAAGAVVDEATWLAIRDAGRDPGVDLAQHDAYRSLDVAHALLRTGLSGTNMLDVAIAVVEPQPVNAFATASS